MLRRRTAKPQSRWRLNEQFTLSPDATAPSFDLLVKVLVIHSELGVLRGGGENFTRNLFSAFASRGHEVKAAFLADNKRNYPIPLPSNIEPIPIPGWWSRNAGQRAFSSIRHHLPCIDRFGVGWDRLK